MKVNLTPIISFLFLVTLFFIPFDGVGILPFGEFSKEAYFLFLLLFMVIYGFTRLTKPIKIPKFTLELQLLVLFIIITIISSVINLPQIFSNQHPLRNGTQKLISQIFVLLLFFPVVTFLFYDFFKNNESITFKIRYFFLIALYFVFAVGFFETIYIYSRQEFTDNFIEITSKIFLDFFSSLPLVDITTNHWDKRLSSITREPPSLGMFLITVLPWIISLKPLKKIFWSYYLPLGMILFLAIFSNSRSGLFIILLQFLFFGFLKYTHSITYRKLLNAVRLTGALLFLVIIVFVAIKDTEVVKKRLESYNFIENYNQNQSNKTRLGTYLASFEEIKKRPLIGGGFGQAGFYVLNNYPSWAIKDNVEIERYIKGERFPPVFNIYLRLLLESGIIGLIVFLMFLFGVFIKGMSIYYRNKSDIKGYGSLIILSLIGYSITWMQFDTYRVLGFWLFFSFYLYTINIVKKDEFKFVR